MKSVFVFKKICVLLPVMLLIIAIQTNKTSIPVKQASLYNQNYLTDIEAAKSNAGIETNVAEDLVNEEYICNDSKELSNIVREQMLARNMIFTVNYTGDMPDNVLNTNTFKTFLDSVFAYDDPKTSNDYDYLRISWTSSKLTIITAGKTTQYEFSFGYLTSGSEESIVDTKVDEILKTLNVSDLDNYSKIVAVNSFIIKNVSYDNKMKNKSAYTALTKGSTICRGYVLLAYKMLVTLDVPVRVITGTGNGQAHTWLIVKINDYWYNLDITWNDTTHSDSFFLKCDKDFYMHKEDDCFKTDSFIKSYPKAQKSF